MMLDDIFEENKELPYISSVPWGKKKYEKAIHAKQVSQSVWCGTVMKGKKIVGRWIWDTNRFFSPVFISSVVKVNGKPKRFTKTSCLRENQRIGLCRNQETGGGKQC